MKIILGITGGIAAYKAPELIRLFVKTGIEVEVVMTDAATRFVTPLTLQALSGKPVHLSQWEGMMHIDLSRQADAILVAPATADFIAKVANGHADDLLSSLCLARDCPLYLAPAMNRQMWENAATRRNIERIREDGIHLIGPEEGIQACGETGFGRMTEPDDIASLMISSLSAKTMPGKRFLITAGPTQEPIDPVRVITNLSSGKMGYEIAAAALQRGAEVVLVSGPTCLSAPYGAKLVSVGTAQQMLEAVMENIEGIDVFVGVAAVSDYHVVNRSGEKLKKQDRLILELEPNPDILKTVSSLENPPFCVGFAAETEKLHENARAKLENKKVQMIVGNLARDALGRDDNEVAIFTKEGVLTLPRAAKRDIARQILDEIGKRIS